MFGVEGLIVPGGYDSLAEFARARAEPGTLQSGHLEARFPARDVRRPSAGRRQRHVDLRATTRGIRPLRSAPATSTGRSRLARAHRSNNDLYAVDQKLRAVLMLQRRVHPTP